MSQTDAPKFITAVSRAYAVTEGTYGPDYVAFKVTEEVLSRLESLATTCASHGLSQIRFSHVPEAWGPVGIEERLCLRDGEVSISNEGLFWFTDASEDGSLIESEAQQLAYVRSKFDAAPSGEVLFLVDCDKLIELYQRDHAQEESCSLG